MNALPNIVVLTRPAGQNEAWAQALQKSGFSVVKLPLLEIAPVDDTEPIKSTWQQISSFDWAMFVSANAVHYFFEYRHNTPWPCALRAGATGAGTCRALEAAGVPLQLIDTPGTEQMEDTEHLWQHICQTRHWQGAKTLLVRGSSADNRPERNWLKHQLETAEAHVQVLPVYQRCAPVFCTEQLAWLASTQAKAACWIFSSAQVIEYLPDYDWTQTTAIVTHQRIAQAAHKVGFGQVVYTRPDSVSLVDSVKFVV